MINPISWLKNYFDQYSKKGGDVVETSRKVNALIKDASPVYYWCSWLKALVGSIKIILSFWFVGGFFGYQLYGAQSFDLLSPVEKSKYLILVYVVGSILVMFIDNFWRIIFDRMLKIVQRSIFSTMFRRFLTTVNSMSYSSKDKFIYYENIENYDAQRVDIVLDVFDHQVGILSIVASIILAFVVLFRENPYFLPIAITLGLIQYGLDKFQDYMWPKLELKVESHERKLNNHVDYIIRINYWLSLRGRNQHNFLTNICLKKFDELLIVERAKFSHEFISSIRKLVFNMSFYLMCVGIMFYFIWHTDFSMATIALIIGSFQSFESSINHALYSLGSFGSAVKVFKKFEDFLTESKHEDADRPIDIILSDAPLLECKKIFFRYEDEKQEEPTNTDKEQKPKKLRVKSKNIVRNFSCKFDAGLTAITGPNGCGKSTLMYILANIYEPQRGKVMLEGFDIKAISHKSLYKGLVFMPSIMILSELPLDIAIAGCDREYIDGQRLVQAIRMADLEEFIVVKFKELKASGNEEMQNPYEIEIDDDWWEITSNGQYQRLLLASIFYRALDPGIKIMLLDEPAVHCDLSFKARFYANLSKFKDKIVIVITHDADSLDVFDRVLVIDKGSLALDLDTKDKIQAHKDAINDLLKNDESPE